MRVLVVDDDPDIRLLVRLSLERIGGMTVETCGSGREALVRGREVRPDLVVLDMAMPGMTGPETLRAWRLTPELAGVPVVFLTANTDDDARAEMRALGAIGALAKPFDPRTLAAELVALMTRFQAKNAL